MHGARPEGMENGGEDAWLIMILVEKNGIESERVRIGHMR